MIRIVALNSKYVHTLLAPYYLKANCHREKVEILQCNINQDLTELAGTIMADSPEILAFSCYIFNINQVLEVCRIIRENYPEVVIIFGGPEVSFDPANYPIADYVIVGEGECAFDKLTSDIESGIPSPKVVYGSNVELDTLSTPYTEEYFQDCKGKLAYFEASRGCVFHCAYCMSGKSHLRKFPLEYVTHELDKFASANVRVVKFVDRTFNADKKFALAIMRHIIDNKSLHHLSYHFEIAGDLVDEEFLAVVACSEVGLFQFEIGVQSFNEITLESVCRKSDLSKLKDNIARMVALGNCHIHTDLIAGLPYENMASFRASFDTLYSLKSDMLQLGFLKVLKGSKLRETLERDSGYLFHATPPYEIISTPYLSEKELDELRLVEDIVDKYYNSHSFERTLDRFIIGSPYEFFDKLAKKNYDNHELFARYDNIFNFLIDNGFMEVEVKGHLKLDYLLTNPSRTLPNCLKDSYDRAFKTRLVSLGVDNKKYYCSTIGINPTNFAIEKGIIAVDYRAMPYSYRYYPDEK